eukprot:scaffold5696_cov119-Isochrysis_galbana.AAC.10
MAVTTLWRDSDMPNPDGVFCSTMEKKTGPSERLPEGAHAEGPSHDAWAYGRPDLVGSEMGIATAGGGAQSKDPTGMPGSGSGLPIVAEIGDGAAPKAPSGGRGV